MMSERSDSELIALAKEDPEKFGLLYERYVDKIYSYIYYRTSNHHDAEDLTARTFYRALKHFPGYEDRGAPYSAYLYRIAHNLVANFHRDNSRRQFVPVEGPVMATMEQERHRNPPSVVRRKEVEDDLMEMVDQLASDRQELLYLKFIEGMTNAEIGDVMGRTEGAIKSLYHRTLVKLRELAQEAEAREDEEENNGA